MTETVSLQEAQKEIQDKMAQMKVELKSLGERLFRSGSQDIFDAFPRLKSFGWTQYTPYFNDGDPCEFSVHADYGMSFGFTDTPEVSDGTYFEEDGRYSELSYKVRQGAQEPTKDEEAMLAATTLVTGVDEDTMKALFGDHVEVTVSREGIETTEYEHD